MHGNFPVGAVTKRLLCRMLQRKKETRGGRFRGDKAGSIMIGNPRLLNLEAIPSAYTNLPADRCCIGKTSPSSSPSSCLYPSPQGDVTLNSAAVGTKLPRESTHKFVRAKCQAAGRVVALLSINISSSLQSYNSTDFDCGC